MQKFIPDIEPQKHALLGGASTSQKMQVSWKFNICLPLSVTYLCIYVCYVCMSLYLHL